MFFQLSLCVLDVTTTGAKPTFATPIVLYYYADWCHHSREFAPVFEELEDIYKSRGSQVSFAKFDCMRNVGVCEKLRIHGYPTIVLELGDKQILFRLKKRTTKTLAQWVDKQLEVNGLSQ